MQDRCYTHLVLNYRNKGQSTLNTSEVALPAIVCEAAVSSVSVVQVGTDAVIEWLATGSPVDYRYRIDGGAWTVTSANSATVSGLSFADHNVEVEPRCQCSAGTPLTKNFTINDPSICEPVDYGTLTLPNAFKDLPYNFFITLSGSTPFALTITSKPGWMDISITGNKVYFTGTPPAATVQPDIDITISNCSGANDISLSSTISVIDSSTSPCRAYSIYNDGVGTGTTVAWTDCTGTYRTQFLDLYATIEVCAMEVYPQVGIIVNLITPNYC